MRELDDLNMFMVVDVGRTVTMSPFISTTLMALSD